jgi:hypothetical protein
MILQGLPTLTENEPKEFPVKVRTMYHQLYDANNTNLDISFYMHDEAEDNIAPVRSPYFNFRLKG